MGDFLLAAGIKILVQSFSRISIIPYLNISFMVFNAINACILCNFRLKGIFSRIKSNHCKMYMQQSTSLPIRSISYHSNYLHQNSDEGSQIKASNNQSENVPNQEVISKSQNQKQPHSNLVTKDEVEHTACQLEELKVKNRNIGCKTRRSLKFI